MVEYNTLLFRFEGNMPISHIMDTLAIPVPNFVELECSEGRVVWGRVGSVLSLSDHTVDTGAVAGTGGGGRGVTQHFSSLPPRPLIYSVTSLLQPVSII